MPKVNAAAAPDPAKADRAAWQRACRKAAAVSAIDDVMYHVRQGRDGLAKLMTRVRPADLPDYVDWSDLVALEWNLRTAWSLIGESLPPGGCPGPEEFLE